MLLLPENARLIGQGITGSEGSKALPGILDYKTNIVGGVTPKKGGQELLGVPIFDSVKEALEKVGPIDGSMIYVPPLFVKSAVLEAIEAGIKFILIFTEKVPTSDTAYFYALAKEKGVSLVGPTSAGMINPKKKLKIGSIGGSDPNRAYKTGNIAVISKSGSMTSEISLHLGNNGLGVSWATCIGGDRIIGTDYGDLLMELEKDSDTLASVIFGELGGTYEERVGQLVKEGKIKKPVVAFISGDFTAKLPSDVQFGHAGAIIEGERGRPDHKRKVLKDSEVIVAEDFDDIAKLVKEAIA